VNVRFRRLPSDEASGPKYRVCSGRPLPLFNADRLGEEDPIVCEGELDVVALHEYGWTESVVSGTGGASTFREEWLDLLEPSGSLLLCYDDDEAGKKGATALAEKLGAYRCSRVRLPRNDAGACLAEGVDREIVARAFEDSESMLGIDVASVSAFAEEIERIAENPEELVGRPTGSAKLDEAIGGLRPGLIVLSGETGQGKTTFATWLLAQQARMGVPTLLTSMEQSPVGTVQKLLRGQIGGDFLAVEKPERVRAMEALGRLPLHILRHRGNIGRSELLDAVRFSVRRRGVRNVLVDHLGFVVNPDADDERKEIESIVRELSILSEHEGVSIVLICHPSNMHVAQKRRVSLSDLKGASAIRQDAHEVWIVEAAKPTKQRVYPASWIHFDKVRSDYGASGASVLLAFDPLATTYADSWGETPSGQRGVTLVQATKPGKAKPSSDSASSPPEAGGALSRSGRDAASGA
jgi:twinkle protein